MRDGRNRKHPPPAPGGVIDQPVVAGPVTYVYPMPPAKSFGKLIPCDDEMEVEEVKLTPPVTPSAGLRITVSRVPEPMSEGAKADQEAGNAATLAALETLLRQYAASGYRVRFELTADSGR
jgi:hypothetical protein